MLTPKEARELFRARGETIGSWADSRGFSRQIVYAVLRGRLTCERGTAHAVAVALGIKASVAPETAPIGAPKT